MCVCAYVPKYDSVSQNQANMVLDSYERLRNVAHYTGVGQRRQLVVTRFEEKR